MADFYVIDGYNLIHALGLIDHPPGKGVLETARRRLLDFLKDSFDDDCGQVTIVFDAQHAPPRIPRQESYHHLHIHFAPRKQSADDVIETMIEEHARPRTLVVISNDGRLQQAARRRGARAWSHSALLDFFEKRQARLKKTAAASEEQQPGPMTAAEKDHWLKEFKELETDPELKEFFDMDRFED